MRSKLDKWPGSKTITLIAVLVLINILQVAGVVTDDLVANMSTILYPAIAGTAYLGLTRK